MDRKEAVEVVRKNWPYSRHQLSEALLTLIPELGENEDENLRKGLIEHLKELKGQSVEGSNLKRPEHYDAWIAWLEKKDDQKSCKGSPKYKAGDWIVCCDYEPEQIICVRTDAYEMSNGDLRPFHMIDDNHNIRPWTIQDAKDGDVLAEHETIVLFKKTEGQNIRCYCTYHYLGYNPTFHVDTLQNKTPYRPATKEQCDKLEKAITKAGYKWVAEKKELKKIEQNPVPRFKVGDRIYDKKDSYNRNVIREVGKDYYINAFAQKMDMAYTDANFEFLEHLEGDHTDSKSAVWSKEDEEMLACFLHKLEVCTLLTNKECQWANKKLKATKECSWKPSAEQMWALHLSGDDSWAGKRLRSLYADLEKVYGKPE